MRIYTYIIENLNIKLILLQKEKFTYFRDKE